MIERESNLPYVASHIIKRNRWQEFKEIPINRIKPIVHNIKDTKPDNEMLWNWELHFKGYVFGKKVLRSIPYIITQCPKTKIKTLWKEGI